jgi:phosphate-selective porin OprO and OprP
MPRIDRCRHTFRIWIGAIVAAALLSAAAVTPAHAEDSLLDVLRQKKVLTPQEYERLKGTTLSPAQRSGLIDMLRDKGILTPAEVNKLATAASPPAALPPAAMQPASAPAMPQLGYDEGFFIRTPDGHFRLKFNGRVSSNFAFFEPGTTQTDTQTVDRARLGVDATFYQYFRMRLENDFTSSSGLRDGFIAVMPMPEFNLQLGQFKVPFSYEELVSKRYIDFVERSAVVNSTVSPSRDIGIMAYGEFAKKLVQYQLAVMNGAGQNQKDNNGDKDLIARLVVAPFKNDGPEHLRGLSFGGAVTYGNQPADTAATGAKPPTSSIGGLTETGFTFFPAVTRHGKRLREGWHVAWLDGPYSITSEYIRTEESRGSLAELDTDGAYVGATWMLTGEDKPFNRRIHPRRPLWDLKKPGWGAWEAALRYEYFKLRHGPAASDPEVDNRYDAVVAGLNWYPNEFLRFSVNYLYGSFDRQGKGLSPNPDKRSNNAVLGRAQLEF